MRIKICGIRSVEAAQAAAEYGADLIGFVFADSRRRIDAAAAAVITDASSGPATVGVFVNQPLSEVKETAARCRLDHIQLHGGESREYCRSLDRPLIRALPAGPGFREGSFVPYADEWLLLDAFLPGQTGGTGVAFDWESIRCRMGRPPCKFFVAGGLTPENVATAIRILRPDGVDVSGGVETSGFKDPEKIRRFILAARAAERTYLC